MYPLKEVVEINRKFEKSINLQLDLSDIDKINGYIPTQSSVRILKEYMQDILENKEKATILIGPYGKGKSHLLLVLLAILHMDKEALRPILQKIASTDKETAELITTFLNKKQRFLPVVISSSSDDLNQAFLLGLHEALEKFQITDISIQSFYYEAIRIIDKWEKEFPKTYQKLVTEVSNRKMDIAVFIKQLKEYKEDTLKLFQEIYPLLTSGSTFQPMVHTEIMDLYEEVCTALMRQHDFAGIYIIFDEFSKYIEGHKLETFAQDMKKIQDICELANHSKKSNVFITFVAHKSMKEYGRNLDKNVVNAFRGVEGRLSEKLFVVSSQNNYELLTNTIIKKNKFDEICDREELTEIQDKTYRMDYFKTLFEQKEYEKYIAKGCYPLTPLAAYLLIHISEKAAQNERTIFTFMAGDEYGSLYRILKEQSADEYFVGTDKIYDYFKVLFKDNLNQPKLHNEWLKAEYTLSLLEDENEKKIIKAMALLHMLKDSDEIVANDEVLRLALGLGQEAYDKAITNLKEKKMIVWRNKLGLYTFTNRIGVDLEKEIQKQISKSAGKLRVTEELEKISVLDFVLPRAYNQKFTMTRFYRYMFMEEEVFLSLAKSEFLFQELEDKKRFADGIILLILPDADGKAESVKVKTETLKDERLVVLYPKSVIEVKKHLQQIKAIEELLEDKEFTESNQVLIRELGMNKEDFVYEINQKLMHYFEISNKNCHVFYSEDGEAFYDTEPAFNHFLGTVFEKYYTNTPRINNELLNVRNIGKQYKKARNTIVDAVLNGEDLSGYIKGTSPEAIIYRAALLRTGVIDAKMEMESGCKEVLEQMEVFMNNAEGEKVSFEVLMKLLTGKNYGARKGVLPLFMAAKFASLSSIPFIYLKSKEVEISAATLDNICEKPSEYFLYVEKENAQKERYLRELETMFLPETINGVYNRRKRVCIIVEKMQSWYRALPQVSLSMLEGEASFVKKAGEVCKLLRKVDINPREALFDNIPALLGEKDDWQAAAGGMKAIKCALDESFLKATNAVIAKTKAIFGFNNADNLCTALMEWYADRREQMENHIFSDKVGNLKEYLKSLTMYDETACIKRLTKIVLDVYLEDFTAKNLEEYEAELKKALEEIASLTSGEESVGATTNKLTFLFSDGKKVEKTFAKTEEDSTSYFLKNAIESAIEEFGDTLDQNQKLAVLIKTIEELF